MSLEELTQRATITFPILATVEDVELLFCYLRQGAGLITEYSVDTRKQTGNEFEEPREYDIPAVRSYQLDGKITAPPSTVAGAILGTSESWDFRCPTQEADDEKIYFSELKFFTTPGWSLGDYRQNTLQLWDQVRELTGKYFELRKPTIEE